MKRALVGAAIVLGLTMPFAQAAEPPPATTANHKEFEALKGPFASAPDVTKACLSCHNEAAKQVFKSIHWTWEFEHPETGQLLGKRHVINSFCGNLDTNEPLCTSCHAGYGWEDAETFDFANEENVDCLVCHDTTGEYVKWPTAAGHPLYEPVTSGKRNGLYPDALVIQREDGKFTHLPPDLARVAMNIGMPDRENCGACHFYGGGGDNVKHGDISSALISPSPHVDVHMSPDGADMVCTDCHVAHGHEWPGSRYLGTVKDGTEPRSGFRRTDALACDTCHTDAPHDTTTVAGIKLNGHTERIACQTCHIPEYAKGGVPTKTWWDWSTAGRLRDGKLYTERDEQRRPIYVSKKGSFLWGEDIVPEYAFWNGVVEYTLLGEEIDPSGIVDINRIHGSADDPQSLIYPFKRMGGKQAYDTVNNHLLLNSLYDPGSDTAFWNNFDWRKSLTAGMAGTDVPFSGEYAFAETQMWWPTTHMVAPADEALGCDSCHAKDGRLASLGGIYLPGRDGFEWTDRIGLGLLALSLGGVGFHAAIRIVMSRRRQNGKG